MTQYCKLRIQAGKILVMLVVFSSVAIGSSYLMSGFLGIETIEAITIHVDYYSHWNGTLTVLGKVEPLSGFGKMERTLISDTDSGQTIEFQAQKLDDTYNVLIIRAMKGDQVIAQASTSDPNSVAVISFTLNHQN